MRWWKRLSESTRRALYQQGQQLQNNLAPSYNSYVQLDWAMMSPNERAFCALAYMTMREELQLLGLPAELPEPTP